MTRPKRGRLYWFEFPPPDVSHSPAGRRPVIVVQSDIMNDSRLPTVIVASLTSNLAAARYPGAVFIPAGVAGLPKDSVVKLTELMTIDSCLLVDELGDLPTDLMAEVDAGIRISLGV
ncbi:MAG: type II toxin-antitoxin system PemK/MazF family toxin [Propionibacteriaceae bacterium]|nr:type II toxin-antitoxin system PemK/MazF family toxin [Propionibacteriaceae bacterium]